MCLHVLYIPEMVLSTFKRIPISFGFNFCRGKPIPRQQEEMEALLVSFDDQEEMETKLEMESKISRQQEEMRAKLELRSCLRTRSCLWRARLHATSVVVYVDGLAEFFTEEKSIFWPIGFFKTRVTSAKVTEDVTEDVDGAQYEDRVVHTKCMAQWYKQHIEELGPCEDEVDQALAQAIENAALS